MINGLIGVHNPLSTWKQGNLPSNPVVQLLLNQNLGQKEGFPLLTSTLSSDAEIDEVVASFKVGLDHAAKNAKKMLRMQRDKMIAATESQTD
jgi:hypothetical protein